jgi:hypothetical protein
MDRNAAEHAGRRHHLVVRALQRAIPIDNCHGVATGGVGIGCHVSCQQPFQSADEWGGGGPALGILADGQRAPRGKNASAMPLPTVHLGLQAIEVLMQPGRDDALDAA